MAVITSLVAKITFVVAEITFKVVVITSSVVKITFLIAEITFQSGCDHFCKMAPETGKVITNIYTIYNLHEREVLLVFTKNRWK